MCVCFVGGWGCVATAPVCVLCPLFVVVCCVPVGGVPDGSVMLLLRVLDGVSWRGLNGECCVRGVCLWSMLLWRFCGSVFFGL